MQIIEIIDDRISLFMIWQNKWPIKNVRTVINVHTVINVFINGEKILSYTTHHTNFSLQQLDSKSWDTNGRFSFSQVLEHNSFESLETGFYKLLNEWIIETNEKSDESSLI